MKNAIIHLFLISSMFWMSGCASETTKNRSEPSKPSEQDGEIPGYLDSVEKDVSTTTEMEISIGNTVIKIPNGSSASDYKVRLSRRHASPALTAEEALVLGDNLSDVVDVEFFNPSTSVIMASTDLLVPYEFRQTFKSTSSSNNIGLMIIADAGSPDEQRILLPNSELKISQIATGLALAASTEIRVRVVLKVTNSTMWLVNYTDEALSSLMISAAASITTRGGTSAKDVVISTSSTSIGDAAISINSDAAYTNSESVVLTLTATGASEMFVTNSPSCDEGGNWEPYSATKSWTLNSLNSVARVYARFRTLNGGKSLCKSDGIIHDNIAPSPPSGFNDGTTSSSLASSPSLLWTSGSDGGSGISHYEIAIGSQSGETNIKTWTNVGNVTTTMLTGLSLNTNSTYFASIRSVDGAGLKSSIVLGDGFTVSTSSLTCPTNWIKVPADNTPEVSTAEFCVMKYEAKNISNVPTSQPAALPWSIYLAPSHSNGARNACLSLGPKFDLISNAQWQAIGRNIETAQSVPGNYLNWSGNSISGNNYINQGHSISTPWDPIAASTDNDPCSGIGSPNCADHTHSDFRLKRTHTLSNGEVIWDFAGNMWEWVKDNSHFLYTSDENLYSFSTMNSTFGNECSTANSCFGPQGKPKAAFGPIGNYGDKTSFPYGGLGRSRFGYDGGTIMRGGGYGGTAAIFAVWLDADPPASDGYGGFRCVKTE